MKKFFAAVLSIASLSAGSAFSAGVDSNGSEHKTTIYSRQW